MIIQNFAPFVGGAERQALELSGALVRRGHEVTVLTRRLPGTAFCESIEGVRVRRLPAFGSPVLNAAVFSISLFFFLLFHWARFDVFHIHLASSHALVPAILGRLCGKKVVIKLGGGFDIGELALSRRSSVGRLKLAVLGWAHPSFIIVNEGQRSELNASGLGSSATLVPNGVNLGRFRPPTASERAELRARLSWDGVVFLFVGRFAADKLRIDIFERLIEAWAGVAAQEPRIRMVLVGQGPLEDDYRERIAARGVGSSVTIAGVRSDVSDLYKAADLFLLPSITEGLSNALLEALASGLPAAASRVSGIVEIVQDGAQGYLFDPMSSADIARALTTAVRDGAGRERMKAACLETARRYSLDDTAERTLQVYEGAA